jgi:hypothetical protein
MKDGEYNGRPMMLDPYLYLLCARLISPESF